jgi:hypothetical protein
MTLPARGLQANHRTKEAPMSKRRISLAALIAATATAIPVLTGSFGVGAASARPEAAGAAAPQARFEWRVPERTGRDGDGVEDAVRTPDDVTPPAGWPVHFDACGSTAAAGAAIVNYSWDIDHQLAGEGPQCAGFTHYSPKRSGLPRAEPGYSAVRVGTPARSGTGPRPPIGTLVNVIAGRVPQA